MAYIYKITNQINGMIYVGATTRDVNIRLREHCNDAKQCSNRPLCVAIRRYGSENFTVDIIEECEEDNLESREIYWINKLDSFRCGYNATTGGKGKPYVDKTQIIELWNKQKCVGEILKITSYSKDSVRDALREANISADDRLGRGHVLISKQVSMLDISDGSVVKTFPSIREAYRFLGKVSNGHIEQVCKGVRNTAYGYKWRYLS